MIFWNPVVIEMLFWGLNFELRLFGLFTLLATLSAYPFYILAMVKRKQTPPRSTWFLWVALDIVLFGSRLGSGNFDALLFAYTIGTFLVALFTIKYGRKGWTKFETVCALVVVLTIIIWAIAGPFVATICAIAGCVISGLPLFIRVLRGGYEDLRSWYLILISGILNLIDGQILISVCFIGMQLSIILPILYHWKYLPRKKKAFSPGDKAEMRL